MTKPRITAIIQARMGSARFPGKTLHPLMGEPMLACLFERLSQSSMLHQIIVATSKDPIDDPIAAFCRDRYMACYRGRIEDVAHRFKEIIEGYKLPAFIRVCGDSPLLDPALIDQAVNEYFRASWDIVTNVSPRTYPRGQSVEVLRSEVFLRGYDQMSETGDREHVTSYFYKSPGNYRIYRMQRGATPPAYPHLAVDTPEDLKFIETVARRLGAGWKVAHLDQILEASQAYA